MRNTTIKVLHLEVYVVLYGKCVAIIILTMMFCEKKKEVARRSS